MKKLLFQHFSQSAMAVSQNHSGMSRDIALFMEF
jgi:hypothetical protein